MDTREKFRQLVEEYRNRADFYRQQAERWAIQADTEMSIYYQDMANRYDVMSWEISRLLYNLEKKRKELAEEK